MADDARPKTEHHDRPADLDTEAARQGETSNRVRWILGFSTAGVVLAFVVIWFWFAA